MARNKGRGRIFISYRRGVTSDLTGRIEDSLREHFDVFRDIENIPVGVDFRTFLQQALDGATTLVVVIGEDFVENRRLHDPGNFIRIELEHALTRNIPIVPVLVGSAQLPKSDDLPASLHPLLNYQAIQVDRHAGFRPAMGRLISGLLALHGRSADDGRPAPSKGGSGYLVAGLVLAAVLVGVGVMIISTPGDPTREPPDEGESLIAEPETDLLPPPPRRQSVDGGMRVRRSPPPSSSCSPASLVGRWKALSIPGGAPGVGAPSWQFTVSYDDERLQVASRMYDLSMGMDERSMQMCDILRRNRRSLFLLCTDEFGDAANIEILCDSKNRVTMKDPASRERVPLMRL